MTVLENSGSGFVGIDSKLIKETMLSSVDKFIDEDELRKLLQEFVEFQSKDGFPFGELGVLHYNMFSDKENDEIYKIAAAIEILVLAFDILDDLEDQDSEGKPWLIEKSSLVLNSTTALIFLSLNIITNTDFENKDTAINLFTKFALRSIHGQHKDLLNVCHSEDEYLDMTIEKSGSLVALACLMGTILATKKYLKEIELYSKYIGLVAQINNDLEGIEDLNDIIHKKFSLPIIYLLNSEKGKILTEYYNNNLSKDDLINHQNNINKIFLESGAIIYTRVIKKLYQNKIKEQLSRLEVKEEYVKSLKNYIK